MGPVAGLSIRRGPVPRSLMGQPSRCFPRRKAFKTMVAVNALAAPGDTDRPPLGAPIRHPKPSRHFRFFRHGRSLQFFPGRACRESQPGAGTRSAAGGSQTQGQVYARLLAVSRIKWPTQCGLFNIKDIMTKHHGRKCQVRGWAGHSFLCRIGTDHFVDGPAPLWPQRDGESAAPNASRAREG